MKAVRVITNPQAVRWPPGLGHPLTTSKFHLLLPAWAAPHRNTALAGVSCKKKGKKKKGSQEIPQYSLRQEGYMPPSPMGVWWLQESQKVPNEPCCQASSPHQRGCCWSVATICCSSCWWFSNRLCSTALKPRCSQPPTSPYLTPKREAEDHSHTCQPRARDGIHHCK